MSKLPSYRRINVNDYEKEDQPLVDTLSSSINYGFDSLYSVLNNGATIVDNLDATIKDVSITVDANGKPTSSTSFQLNTAGAIQGLTVIRAINSTNPNVYPTSGIFVSYTQATNTIVINNVAGLPANNLFTLRIWAMR